MEKLREAERIRSGNWAAAHPTSPRLLWRTWCRGLCAAAAVCQLLVKQLMWKHDLLLLSHTDLAPACLAFVLQGWQGACPGCPPGGRLEAEAPC